MSKDDEKEKKPEFKVNDRRRFTEDGEVRQGAQEGDARSDQPSVEKENEATSKEGLGGARKEALPEIDFPTFILSLATSAQVHLGVIPNPTTGKKETDLPLAKQTIDILGVLDEKTKGNLSDEEARLLEHLLYDLRMMYVEKNK